MRIGRAEKHQILVVTKNKTKTKQNKTKTKQNKNKTKQKQNKTKTKTKQNQNKTKTKQKQIKTNQNQTKTKPNPNKNKTKQNKTKTKQKQNQNKTKQKQNQNKTKQNKPNKPKQNKTKQNQNKTKTKQTKQTKTKHKTTNQTQTNQTNNKHTKTMEKKELNDFEELVDCPVCLNILERPLMIPCGHVYCEKCILKLLQSQLNNKNKNNNNNNNNYNSHSMSTDQTICCPLCNAMYPIPSSGVRAFVCPLPLMNLVEKIRQLKHLKGNNDDNKDNLILCDNGDNKIAVKRCITCKAFYCDDCLSTLHKSTRDHQLISLEDYAFSKSSVRNCPIHQNEELNLYCTEDHTIVCARCIAKYGFHQHHRCESVVQVRANLFTKSSLLEKQITKNFNKMKDDLLIKQEVGVCFMCLVFILCLFCQFKLYKIKSFKERII